MSDKTKNFTAPSSKVVKSKRPSTVSVASTSVRAKLPQTSMKEKPTVPRSSKFKNTAILSDGDVAIMKEEGGKPDFDAEYRRIAYGKFLRAMLEECLVDEKIECEETEMDNQMAHLLDRFQKTKAKLDKTNKRLKDVSFVVEQKRLIDLKNKDCSRLYEMTDTSNVEDLLQNLNTAEQACLDQLETKNIDFGYDKDSGHKQLLDAVTEAIEGLDLIKKHSNLDMHKFKEYEKSQTGLKELGKDRMDLENLKSDFEAKFPNLSEELLKEASEKIARMIEDDD